jgi:hypothetical protein
MNVVISSRGEVFQIADLDYIVQNYKLKTKEAIVFYLYDLDLIDSNGTLTPIYSATLKPKETINVPPTFPKPAKVHITDYKISLADDYPF